MEEAMSAKERISLEIKAHRKAIEEYMKDLKYIQIDINNFLEKINSKEPLSGVGGYKTLSSIWGLLATVSEDGMKKQKAIEELAELIVMKTPLIIDNGSNR